MGSCLIIAGEKSGEEHAMSFFPELRELCPNTDFYGVGGEELNSSGMELLYHLKDFSSMGFSEVIGKIPFYFKALKKIEKEVVKRDTKTAILIDFQDFNMRLAKKLSRRGVKVLYYVAPQAWVWKAGRAKTISEVAHTLFTILPFEKEWFGSRGVKQIKAIPHPLMIHYKDELATIPQKPFESFQTKLKILLLPGSRKFEIMGLLPEFIKAIRILKETMNIEVHMVTVDHVDEDIYKLYEDAIDVFYPSSDLVNAMKVCHVALAASGTVTLSTGLFELPTIVCYKAGLLNEFIFYNFIKYQGPVSLTNIIHNQLVYPEYIQNQVIPSKIAQVIRTWTSDEKLYNEIKTTLKATKKLLSGDDFSVPQFISQVIND